MNNATAAIASNPFALMMTPADVMSAVEQSSSLRSLRQQQYLLLDRPAAPGASAETSAFDAEQEDFADDMYAYEDPPISESVGASTSYQSFPRVFN